MCAALLFILQHTPSSVWRSVSLNYLCTDVETLSFLRQVFVSLAILRTFNVCRTIKRRTIKHLFYKSTVQSVLCYCLICWGGNLSVKSRVLVNRVVQSASKIIGTTLQAVDELYESWVIMMTTHILIDTSNPLLEFYSIAKSERSRTNRYYNTFLPTSVRLFNEKSGRGNDRGGGEM